MPQKGFIEGMLIKCMLSNMGAYFLSCLTVVITTVMVGALVDSNSLAAVSLCLPSDGMDVVQPSFQLIFLFFWMQADVFLQKKD